MPAPSRNLLKAGGEPPGLMKLNWVLLSWTGAWAPPSPEDMFLWDGDVSTCLGPDCLPHREEREPPGIPPDQMTKDGKHSTDCKSTENVGPKTSVHHTTHVVTNDVTHVVTHDVTHMVTQDVTHVVNRVVTHVATHVVLKEVTRTITPPSPTATPCSVKPSTAHANTSMAPAGRGNPHRWQVPSLLTFGAIIATLLAVGSVVKLHRCRRRANLAEIQRRVQVYPWATPGQEAFAMIQRPPRGRIL